jgi:patatin-like phospholipase
MAEGERHSEHSHEVTPMADRDGGSSSSERGKEHAATKPPQERWQVVLVFQGGGALGAYQAGVYQALQESGIEPDWIIGTSIGAINASLIAGNEPNNRVERLEEFWRRMRRKEFWGLANWPGLAETTSYWSTVLGGIPGFFEPNPLAFLGANYPLGRDNGLLLHGSAGEDFKRACGFFPHRTLHPSPHSRRRASAHK